jgi:hypothetical protein
MLAQIPSLRRRNYFIRGSRSVVALALITLIVVVILSLVMARQFEQPSWIAKAVHGAADASAPRP